MSWDSAFQPGEVWDDLLEVDPPAGCEHVAVLRAFLDASSRTKGLFTVCCYLFESQRVRGFRRQWLDTFGSEVFSWADLIARSGPFDGLQGRQHNDAHLRLVSRGVQLVREYTVAGSVVSCWAQDVENFSPRWVKGFGHPYSIASHIAVFTLAKWAVQNRYGGGISYFLEAGDEHCDEAIHLLSYARLDPVARAMYQWRQHSVLPKDAGAPFHAPDLLAWEYGKFMTESVFEKKRPMRLSMAHLLVDKLDNYSFSHLHGAAFLKFLDSIRGLGWEQIRENAVAHAPPPMDLRSAVASSQRQERNGDPS